MTTSVHVPMSPDPVQTSLATRLLRLIALFEGSQGGKINVWDEQFLSVGTLHYAVGQGPGYTFLARVRSLDLEHFRSILGAPFDDAVAKGPAALKVFCRQYVWQKPTLWQPQFTRLATLPAFAQADRECAQPYIDGAKRLAKRYGLTSERGLAWALDRCVQQGPAPRRRVDQTFAALPKGLPEYQIMKALARTYAATAKPKYFDTVLERSLTVALGSTDGTGYPGSFRLQDRFQIFPDRAWAGQI